MISSIISAITTTITSFLEGMGDGVVQFFTSIFLTGSGESQTISVLGTFILVLVGIGMALAIIRLVWGLIGGYNHQL